VGTIRKGHSDRVGWWERVMGTGDGSCPNRFLLLRIMVGLRPPGFRLAARLSCLTPTVRPAARS
jgi:hypothetical protein